MRNYYRSYAANYETRIGEIVVGTTGHNIYVYDRYYARKVIPGPPIADMNQYFGRRVEVEFMRRSSLPKMLADKFGTIVAREQLPASNLYFYDHTLDRYYWAATVDLLTSRSNRRHYISHRVSPQDVVEPNQRLLVSVSTSSKKVFGEFKQWYDQVLKAEEAINVLEPNRGPHLPYVLTSDLIDRIRDVYMRGGTPGAVLAELTNCSYSLPPANMVGIGTKVMGHEYLRRY